MRARHRHFNPRDAGAGLVLDARFIRQGNNTAVSSWADRGSGGNNADQATGAYQPTYQRNAINGQPAVRFDGTDDEFNSAHLISGTTSRTLVVAYKQTKVGNRQCPMMLGPTNGALTFNMFATTSEIGIRANGASIVYDSSVGASESAIVTTILSGTNLNGTSIRKNGALLSVSSSANTSTNLNTSGSTWLGVYFPRVAGVEQFFGGDVGSVAAVAEAASTSILKRIEHAAAFSFKLSCN